MTFNFQKFILFCVGIYVMISSISQKIPSFRFGYPSEFAPFHTPLLLTMLQTYNFFAIYQYS